MKLFCFFIIFVFASVSTDEEAEYKIQVVITNAAIKQAFNMRLVVNNDDISGLERVIMFFAENNLRSIGNRRYTSVSIGVLNLMIAVPDKIENATQTPGNSDLSKIRASTLFQFKMSDDIEHILRIRIPTIRADDEALEKDLATLAEERRSYTGPVVKKIIRRVLDFENLTKIAEERRINPAGSSSKKFTRTLHLGNLINPKRCINPADTNDNYGISIITMCRLIAMLMSIKFPSDYIRKYEIAVDGTCTLWDGIINKKYTKIKGVWWEVDVNDINHRLQLLRTKLD